MKAGSISGVNSQAGISHTNAAVKANKSKMPAKRNPARLVPDLFIC